VGRGHDHDGGDQPATTDAAKAITSHTAHARQVASFGPLFMLLLDETPCVGVAMCGATPTRARGAR